LKDKAGWTKPGNIIIVDLPLIGKTAKGTNRKKKAFFILTICCPTAKLMSQSTSKVIQERKIPEQVPKKQGCRIFSNGKRKR